MKRIKIIPTSQRAKNRVAEHGEVMLLEHEETFDGEKAIFVRSVHETWGTAGRKENWCGWFTETECKWELLPEL